MTTPAVAKASAVQVASKPVASEWFHRIGTPAKPDLMLVLIGENSAYVSGFKEDLVRHVLQKLADPAKLEKGKEEGKATANLPTGKVPVFLMRAPRMAPGPDDIAQEKPLAVRPIIEDQKVVGFEVPAVSVAGEPLARQILGLIRPNTPISSTPVMVKLVASKKATPATAQISIPTDEKVLRLAVAAGSLTLGAKNPSLLGKAGKLLVAETPAATPVKDGFVLTGKFTQGALPDGEVFMVADGDDLTVNGTPEIVKRLAPLLVMDGANELAITDDSVVAGGSLVKGKSLLAGSADKAPGNGAKAMTPSEADISEVAFSVTALNEDGSQISVEGLTADVKAISEKIFDPRPKTSEPGAKDGTRKETGDLKPRCRPTGSKVKIDGVNLTWDKGALMTVTAYGSDSPKVTCLARRNAVDGKVTLIAVTMPDKSVVYVAFGQLKPDAPDVTEEPKAAAPPKAPRPDDRRANGVKR